MSRATFARRLHAASPLNHTFRIYTLLHRQPQETSPRTWSFQLRRHAFRSTARPYLTPTRVSKNLFLVLAFASPFLYALCSVVRTESPDGVGSRDEQRRIRLPEVQAHGRDAKRKWVIYKSRVYDITDWIPVHPGGEVIERALGGSVERYWDIFTIHKNGDVRDILESYYIGDIDERDLVGGEVPSTEIDDPFETDPLRSSRLFLHTERPCNAETPKDALESFITPNEYFYVRNHLWVPAQAQEEADEQTVSVELPDGTEREYSIRELKRRFSAVSITATLQCSGNRRKHMSEGAARSASGLQWDCGAISTAEWTGARLRDVLADAGFDVDAADPGRPPENARHVCFLGAEAYGASIPIDKAVDRRGDVLLAYAMNGEPLPRDHGFPLRLLAPGTVAARSVKWLKRISLSEEESTSQWQRRDYKCFGPNQQGTDPPWDLARSIQDTPVQSAIVKVRDLPAAPPRSVSDRRALREHGLEEEQEEEEDSVMIHGYAFAGGGREIVRVDVSVDDGRNWHQADLLEDEAKGHKSWAWRRWRFACPKRLAGEHFVVKAVDEAYNTQPESHGPYYNFKGNLANSWHRVPYDPKATDAEDTSDAV